MKSSPNSFRRQAWSLLCFVAFACGKLCGQDIQYGVDTIAALKTVSSASYQCVTVAGYLAPRDGGGGVYTYDPADTTSSDNGGTIIVASDGARWKLTQSNPPSVKQFGAVNGNGSDNSTAIQNALNACAVVWVPPGAYLCTAPITLNSGNALIGLGGLEETDNTAATSGAKLNFFGTGDACIVSDTANPLQNAAIKDIAIYVDSTATYAWIIHLTEPVGLELSHVAGQAWGYSTGGIKCNVRSSGGGVSQNNHWYDVAITLPGYSGGGSPPPETAESLDLDFTGSELTSGHFTGGTGAYFRGVGGTRLNGVRIDHSVAYNVYIEHDIAGSLSNFAFTNCSLEQSVSGQIFINLDAEDVDVPNICPQFVGNSIWAPGATTPLIVVQNATGPAATSGGIFSNNTYLVCPTTVYTFPNGGAGWTFTHNRYYAAQNFSGLSSATIDEDSLVQQPNLIGAGTTVLAQSGVSSAHTGDTAETALASIPIPANALGTAGKLRISATFSVPGTVYGKTARVRYGNALAGTAFYVGAVSGSAETLIHAICEISMQGTTNSEVTAHPQVATGPGVFADVVTTGAVVASSPQTLTLSGQLGNSSDTITLQQYTVELVNP